MYGRNTPNGWEKYQLSYGDRLVINWHRRAFRAVRRLSAPLRFRMSNARDFAMGFAQPEWQRLWMQDKSGKIVPDLPLPPDLKQGCLKDTDPFLLIPKLYGLEAVGGEALQWAWEEEGEFGRKIMRHSSYVAVKRF